MASNTDWAWVAGFLDGEGCFSNNGNNKVRLSVTQSDREVLEKLQAIIGYGSIYGPYRPQGLTRKPYWSYVHSRPKYLRKTMEHLWPYLGTLKKEQYLRAGTR